MSISINLQPNKDSKLIATSNSYEGTHGANEPFVTFDVTVPGEGRVAIFLRNLEDARSLVDAAIDAFGNVQAQELERRIDAVTSGLPVFGGNTVTEESYNEWLKGGGDAV